jgi:hypothetical protein
MAYRGKQSFIFRKQSAFICHVIDVVEQYNRQLVIVIVFIFIVVGKIKVLVEGIQQRNKIISRRHKNLTHVAAPQAKIKVQVIT